MPDLDSILELAKNLGGILAGVFYVSIVLWTYKDARRRIDDPILVATAVATSMLPIVGVLVYMMLRPPEYLDDVHERALEIRAMERQLGRQERCPYCRSYIESDYRSCPVCKSKLRMACEGCDRPLDPRWVICPYCETEVAAPPRTPTTPPRGGSSKRGERESRPAPRREKAQTPVRAKSGYSGGSSSADEEQPRRGERSGTDTGTRSATDADKASPAKDTPAGGDSASDIHVEPFSHMNRISHDMSTRAPMPAPPVTRLPPMAPPPTGTTPIQPTGLSTGSRI